MDRDRRDRPVRSFELSCPFMKMGRTDIFNTEEPQVRPVAGACRMHMWRIIAAKELRESEYKDN